VPIVVSVLFLSEFFVVRDRTISTRVRPTDCHVLEHLYICIFKYVVLIDAVSW